MFSSESWLSNQQAGFYNGVATQSLRFDDGSSAKLTFTPTSNGSEKKWTWSGWVKRANLVNGVIFSSDQYSEIKLSSDYLYVQIDSNNTSAYAIQTNRVFRDVSSWYHIVVACDTTQLSGTNKLKLYINGTEETSFSSDQRGSIPDNANTTVTGSGHEHRLGIDEGSSNYFDGYLAEVNLIDGLSFFSDTSGTPNTSFNINSFGELKNGVWIAKRYTGSYGTNGFRLQFNRTGTGTASSSTIGADTSGNTHHFTSSGIVASDCDMPDSPENNFATLNPLSFLTENLLQNGNLELPYQTTDHRANTGTMFMQTGKWYFEVYNTTSAASGTVAIGVGLQDISKLLSYASGDDNYVFYSNNNNAKFVSDTSEITLGTGGTHVPTAGSIIQVAYDADTGNIFIGVNNTYIAEDGGSDGNPATGANPTKTLSTNIDYIPFVGVYNNIAIANFGQDSTFAGATTAGGNADGNGKGDFKYSVPSGFLALCSANISDDDLPISPAQTEQADDYFNTVLWIANETDRTIDVGFQPGLVWAKSRSNTWDHTLFDSVRGAGKSIKSNTTGAEATSSTSLTGFVSNGFTLGVNSDGPAINFATGHTFVGWNWKANGSGVSNTDGSITSTVSANTDAGFSIVTYTGTGGTATVGHGLGVKPSMLIVKPRVTTNDWIVYFETLGAGKFLALNVVDPESSNTTMFNNTEPTTTVFSINTPSGTFLNKSGEPYVCYAFNSVEGYSKFGSYTGNDDPNGNMIFTNFSPALVIIKYVSGTAGGTKNWYMWDNKRSPQNVNDNILFANASDAEGADSAFDIDFLSNGFKLRNAEGGVNNGAEYIYMAWASIPFKYANAR